MKIKNFFRLIVAVAVCELAGVIGSVFTAPAVRSAWYEGLIKPALNPPGWVFGPVWITLYALMGVAVFLVWKHGLSKREAKIALVAFGIQLFLNAVWSIIFFGMHNPGWALVDIMALWLAIVWTIAVFYKISRLSAYLLIPYIFWVSFASYLNYIIWTLN